MKNPMLLTKVTLEKERWGDKKGKWSGKAYFNSADVSVDISIDEHHARKILDMCADELLATAKDMSEVMRDNIIEGMSFIDDIKKRLK